MQADTTTTAPLNLTEYARSHRYRLRNLHDGGPVPPAIWKPPKGYRPVCTGDEDRWDAIVGYDGYVAMDGDELSVCLFYKSARGVKSAESRLKVMGGQIDQVGDTELGATVHVEQIEEVLKLIRVSKVPLTNPRGHVESLSGPVPEAVLAPESHGQRRVEE